MTCYTWLGCILHRAGEKLKPVEALPEQYNANDLFKHDDENLA
jgi:hypothetical protein